MPLSPLPVFGLSSHSSHPLLQQWVAMVVQLLVPLRRHDPTQPVPSTRPTLKPLGAAAPNRQHCRQGAAHRLCLQPARTQLSPAGKAVSASPVCEHKHLLGACSETPAQAVQLPASLFQSTIKAEGWLKANAPWEGKCRALYCGTHQH